MLRDRQLPVRFGGGGKRVLASHYAEYRNTGRTASSMNRGARFKVQGARKNRTVQNFFFPLNFVPCTLNLSLLSYSQGLMKSPESSFG